VKKQIFVLCLMIMGLSPLAAATVSVMVIETGLPSEKEITPSASVWESGVMDAFFSAGYIVFNTPILKLKEIPRSGLPQEARAELEAAQLGGSDLFVVVHLSYSGTILNPFDSGEQAKTVFMAVFDVSTEEMLYETSVGLSNMKNPRDEFWIAKQNMGNIILKIKG
jgi:hypothetical protein